MKPDNVLLASDESSEFPVIVKLTDFGLSKGTNQEPTTSRSTTVGDAGNAAYKAPEQFHDVFDNQMYQNVFRSGQYSRHQLDVYAYGGILYSLFQGDEQKTC